MSYKDGFGLRPMVREEADITVGAALRLLPKSSLSKKFMVNVPDAWVREQKWDTCADEALSVLLSHINGYLVDATYTWTVARANGGYAIDDYGVTIKEILLAAKNVGAPRYEESQYHSTDERSVFADIANWDLKAVQPKAIFNKIGAVLFCEPTNGMDYFDTIRSTIETTGNPVLWGMRWNFDPAQPKLLKPSDTGYGHCKLMLGWDDENADIVDLEVSLNSWGINVGVKGRYYVSRELVNHDVAIFGAGTGIDETAEKVRELIAKGIYVNESDTLFNIIKRLILAIKGRLNLPVEPIKNTGVPPYPVKIVKMAEAIRSKEGWLPGSRSRRNSNPGNFKWCGQFKAIGKDAQGFAIFPDDETGWNHLLKVIHNACTGKSLIYPQTMTLKDYFAKYAPTSDGNNPDSYANFVAERIGVPVITQIKDLL